MGTAISCTKCSHVAGLIQKLVETPRNSKVPSLRSAVLRAAVFRSKILCSDHKSLIVMTCVCVIDILVRERVRARAHTEVLEVPEVLMGNKA